MRECIIGPIIALERRFKYRRPFTVYRRRIIVKSFNFLKMAFVGNSVGS